MYSLDETNEYRTFTPLVLESFGGKRVKISQWMRSSIAAAMSFVGIVAGAQTTHRPPAVPLIVNDPYLSIWSMSDTLTESQTMHWSEAIQPLTGLLRVDGKVFRWMGAQAPGRGGLPPMEAMQQTGLEVTPLHTRYRFSAALCWVSSWRASSSAF